MNLLKNERRIDKCNEYKNKSEAISIIEKKIIIVLIMIKIMISILRILIVTARRVSLRMITKN